MFVLCTAAFTAAHAQNFTEAQIKAVYIYKLSKFVQWQGRTPSLINICYSESGNLSRNDSVGQTLKGYLKTQKTTRDYKVHRIRDYTATKHCHIYYIDNSEESSLSNIISRLNNGPTLTISDINRFIYRGGMIGFSLDASKRVKMQGNLKNLRNQKIEVEPDLLELMQKVIR